jgi:hypothetical protein
VATEGACRRWDERAREARGVRAVEEFQFIDIMAGAPPGPSRWDHNPEGAIHALDDALAKAGLPGELSPALKVLERVGQLIDAGRAERDLDAYAAVLRECEPWISDDAAGSTGVGDAARQVRVRAVMTVFGMASGLHQKQRNRCRDVVAVIAGIPDPPADVSQAQTVAAASTLMIRHGREQDWAKFVRLNDQWLAIHAAGRLLRESGQFESELHFNGAPTELGLMYLNWEGAVGKEELRQLPGPFRVRRAHDLGWKPGFVVAVGS